MDSGKWASAKKCPIVLSDGGIRTGMLESCKQKIHRIRCCARAQSIFARVGVAIHYCSCLQSQASILFGFEQKKLSWCNSRELCIRESPVLRHHHASSKIKDTEGPSVGLCPCGSSTVEASHADAQLRPQRWNSRLLVTPRRWHRVDRLHDLDDREAQYYDGGYVWIVCGNAMHRKVQ